MESSVYLDVYSKSLNIRINPLMWVSIPSENKISLQVIELFPCKLYLYSYGMIAESFEIEI